LGDDDVEGEFNLALRGVIQELALKLSDNEFKDGRDIDQALMRMEEGSYGMVVRCGHEIDERRLGSRNLQPV